MASNYYELNDNLCALMQYKRDWWRTKSTKCASASWWMPASTIAFLLA